MKLPVGLCKLHVGKRIVIFFAFAIFLASYRIYKLSQYLYDDEADSNRNNRTIHSADRNSNSAFHLMLQASKSSFVSIQSTKRQPFRKWAYAFLISGCDSARPGYRGMLYNVVISAGILQRDGTKADVILMIQMSSRTNETKLPTDEEDLLRIANIKLLYLPKFRWGMDNFYSVMMEKFRILNLIEYSRVLFLDSDIMPYCALDYLFEVSEPSSKSVKPIVKENVIIAWGSQAANGGFFMLRPGPQEYQEVNQIIRKIEAKALTMEYPYWDKVEGWGHNFTYPDYWRCNKDWINRTQWTWHGAFADQGLLYYWTKYHKKSVSIIIKHEIEHWGAHNGALTREATQKGALQNFTCGTRSGKVAPWLPFPVFSHFTGKMIW